MVHGAAISSEAACQQTNQRGGIAEAGWPF